MDKLKHLIHIVRLLLEVSPSSRRAIVHGCLRALMPTLTRSLQVQDDGQANTYFNRASVYIHDCKDPETLVMYKLCQVRLFSPASHPWTHSAVTDRMMIFVVSGSTE
jgi:hypothetical protein